MNHHFRGDMNSAYTGRKSTLPNPGGLGVGPTAPLAPLPIWILGIIAVIAIGSMVAMKATGSI